MAISTMTNDNDPPAFPLVENISEELVLQFEAYKKKNMEGSSMKNIADIIREIEHEAVTNHTKYKPQFKDYSKENIIRIRQIQSVNRKHNEEIQNPLRTNSKPNKYNHVQAKVTSQFQKPQSSSSSDCKMKPSSGKAVITKTNVLCPKTERDQRIHSSFKNEENKTTELPEKGTRPPSVSKLWLGGTDYIKSNINEAKVKRKSSAPVQARQKNLPTNLENYQRGIVPRYLLQRQKILQKEKQKELEEKSKVDLAGYTIMPETERQETLGLLIKNEQELLQQLASLPVGNDTLRIRQIKEDIEKQLTKIDEGIKIFSQNKVLIKND